MSRMFVLIGLFIFSTASNSNAVQVQYPLPSNIAVCQPAIVTKITKEYINREPREMALVDRSILFRNYGVFYDLIEKCSVEMYLNPDARREERHAFIDKTGGKPGLLFDISAYENKRSGDLILSSLEEILSDQSNYEQWKISKKEKANQKEVERIKKEEERKLNSQTKIPMPKYDKGDSVLGVKANSGGVQFTNKSSEFITIASISTYYNNKINTLSNINIELPPEGTDANILRYEKLLSREMEATRNFIRRDIEKVKERTTKFGFAIKYIVNGAEKKFYAVNDYNNSELLKDEK